MRPSAPSIFFNPYVWAPETNYPAGSDPWSAQPLKSTPLADYLTPGRTLPAEEMNYVLNRLGGDTTAVQTYFGTLLDYIGNIQLQNLPYFSSSYASGGGSHGGIVTKPYWSDFHHAWLYIQRFYGGSADFDAPASSINGGTTGTDNALDVQLDSSLGGPIDTTSVRAWAFGANPTGETFVICGDGNVYSGAAYATSNTSGFSSSAGDQRELHFYSGAFVCFAGKGSASAAQYNVSDPGDGRTWGTATNVPSALQTSNVFSVAKSATRLIAVATDLANVGTYIKMDTSHVVTAGSITLPSGYKTRGIAWVGESTWVMSADNGTATKFYQSIDNGDTWALVATHAARVCLYLAGNGGGTLLAIYGSSAAPEGMWSPNSGGTWYKVDLQTFTTNPSSASRTVGPVIGIAPHQLLATSYQGLRGTICAGLPGDPLT